MSDLDPLRERWRASWGGADALGLPLRRVVVGGRSRYPGHEYLALGETLIRILAELCRWAEEHIEEVEAARRDYDAREES